MSSNRILNVFLLAYTVEIIGKLLNFHFERQVPVAKPGVSKWGVKGEGTGGGVPLPLGVRGLCPRKKFSNCRCTQVSFSAFSIQKSMH
jgi:hypothetical protein